MDGVKDLIRRPRKETATSQDSDRSLLRKGRAAAVRRIVQRFRPAKAVHASLKSIGSVEWFKHSSVQSVARMHNWFSRPLKPLRL
jgi:hypothetical protein